MTVGVNNWLVADSEDEDAFDQLESTSGFGAAAPTDAATTPDVSAIQTAVFTPDQPRTPSRGPLSLSTVDKSLFTTPLGGTELTISDFTSLPSTSAAPLAIAPKSRPRPRVVIKKTTTSGPDAYLSTTFPHISDSSIPATRRTDDSIHSATPASFFFSDTVDDVYSSLDIAERAKMRSRKSQTAKKLAQPPAQTNEVIEFTSDEDELALRSTKRQKKQGVSSGAPAPKPTAQPKARPKPRLKVKPTAVLPSGSPPSLTGISDPPAPVSSLQHGSSQLPASTLPTVPPSTPPQAPDPTTDSSPVVVITRKRKRMRPSIAEDDDEMDIIGGGPPEVSPSSTMPPPFFAPPSSSVPTDSGIEILPVKTPGGRGKRKQGPSGKKGTQKKAQKKGGKGKKAETTIAVDEAVEEAAGVTQDPFTPAAQDNPSFTKERDPPAARNLIATEGVAGKQCATRKGKARAIDSEEEDEPILPSMSTASHVSPADDEEGQRSKENLRPDDLSPPKGDSPSKHASTPGPQVRGSSIKPRSTPMSELIRRVNSQPNSHVSRTYSPLLKSSRTMLSRIAPLHPNRRTPPPPLPRPPPPKKSKKQLEMEERIEEELAETIDGWSCLTDDERKALRKARIDAELGYED